MLNWLRGVEQRLGGDNGGDPGGGNGGGPRRGKAIRWLMIIGLAGVALIILNSFIHVKEVDSIGTGRASPGGNPTKETSAAAEGNTDKNSYRDYEQAYESRLKDVLEKIIGVSEAEVMVTVESDEESVVEKNTKETEQTTNERDQNGATRKITDVTRSGDVVVTQGQGSGSQEPLVLKHIKPKIRGVVVVAKGAENMTVKKLIAEAVEKGLDVPAHRISVIPRKQ